MVGMIHLIFFDLIDRCGGAAAVAAVRARAGLEPGQVYRLDAAYDDGEWQRLLEAGCATLGLEPAAAEDALAEHFLRDALVRWPMWFRMSGDSRSFLLRQPAIHNSLAAGLVAPADRRAVEDKFSAALSGEDLIVHYRSPNRHCGLYKALAIRIIAHYGDQATLSETQCQRAGAEACTIRIRWQRLAGKGLDACAS